MLSAVGTRYAKALVEVVIPRRAASSIRTRRWRNCGRFEALIAGSEALHNALLSPAVSPSRKRAVMARLMEPMGVSKAGAEFSVRGDRSSACARVSSIVEAFESLLDERLGFVRADVSSAFDLDGCAAGRAGSGAVAAGREESETRNFTIDPALIGGRGGARRIDGLRRQRARTIGKAAGKAG